MELPWKMLEGRMRPRFATFESLVESLSLADQAGYALRVCTLSFTGWLTLQRKSPACERASGGDTW
ncbi:hypothetical protein QJS04_geneDACA022460 [Acorus gramineus]|uniref:Uncharacterized protein n=1 Tax=Acorus gramineus TaxID=55184 RepID=A0AAV9BIY3_ACOGR|nr:hypothetical protein QJS04_geneDACA022460 [Acorus gramineus]